MEPIPDIPEGAEGSQVVRDVVVHKLRAIVERLHKENRELRREMEYLRAERKEAA